MVLFDFNIFFLQKYGGISRYIIELCKQMDANKDEYFIHSLIHQNEQLNKKRLNKSFNICLKTYPRFTRKLINSINKFFLYQYANTSNFKILHNTYYGNYTFKKKMTQICSVYDFTHEIFSEIYNYNIDIKKKALSNTNHFICISENTKKDLINFYKIKEELISVVYLGGNHLPKPTHKFNHKPFILYVGYRENYKNFDNLLDAFSLSKILKKDFNIVCFGGSGFNNSEIKKIKDKGLTDFVKHVDGDDQLLSNLYSSASCHVITSKYEGFGLTAIEAFNFNCPVIHTGQGSLKEIANTNGFYDGSSENLSFLLEKNIYSPDILKEMIYQGKLLSKNFTWENCYRDTMKVYKNFT